MSTFRTLGLCPCLRTHLVQSKYNDLQHFYARRSHIRKTYRHLRHLQWRHMTNIHRPMLLLLKWGHCLPLAINLDFTITFQFPGFYHEQTHLSSHLTGRWTTYSTSIPFCEWLFTFLEWLSNKQTNYDQPCSSVKYHLQYYNFWKQIHMKMYPFFPLQDVCKTKSVSQSLRSLEEG